MQARQLVERAILELRDAIQAGDITSGAYHEIKAKFSHRMVRLERNTRKPLLDALNVPDFGTRPHQRARSKGRSEILQIWGQ